MADPTLCGNSDPCPACQLRREMEDYRAIDRAAIPCNVCGGRGRLALSDAEIVRRTVEEAKRIYWPAWDRFAADPSAGFYIADLRPEFRGNPYVTFWRPENAGYAYPLAWAGRYDLPTLRAARGYYWQRRGRSLTRFPVPARVAQLLAVTPAPGLIDGNAGPVVQNTVTKRRKLRRAALTLEEKAHV